MRAGHLKGLSAAAALVLIVLVVRIEHQQLPMFATRHPQSLVGAYHLHSAHSHDSRVPQQSYVDAARALGLDFIVLTDHNVQGAIDESSNATDNGVCVLASAELSTSFGHVVGLGAPAPLSAEQRADIRVLEHIDAQGGRAIVAHPSDGKRPWSGPYPRLGGVEIANWSASVRRQAYKIWPMTPVLTVAWLANRPLALAQAYDRDEVALAIWDAPEQALLHGFCGIDAHGWIAPKDNLSGWHMVLEHTAGTAHRRQAIMSSLQAGHFFCAAGLLGRAPAFEFAAQRGARFVAQAGDAIAQDQLDCLTVRAPLMTLGSTRLVVRRDGHVIADSDASQWRLARPPPGIYRVEVWAQLPQVWGPVRPVPVIYSNKLTVTA